MTGLLQYLAEAALALALFYGLFRLALKNDTHFRAGRAYLLASLLAAHLLPLVRVASPFRATVLSALPQEGLDAAVSAGAGWTWVDAVTWLYLAGAVLVFGRLAWHLSHLLLIARGQPAVRRAGIRLVYIDEDCPPFSFLGTAFVHRPAGGDEQTLDQVVAHERTHIRQRHSLDLLLVQLAAVGQWFNPFIWLYKRSLKELHEYLADREVLAQGFDPFTYRRVLFEQHLGARPFEFAHHLRESQIKRRLIMMTRRSGRWALCKYFLALPAAVLLALVFAEPQVTMARDVTAMGQGQQQAQPASGPAAAADTEKKKKEADLVLKEKIKALKADHAATNDPEKKKIIEKKIAQLQHDGQQPAKVDLDDPVVVETVLKDITKKMDVLKAQGVNGADAAGKEKLEQELTNLSKKIEFLKQRLAELQAAK